MHDPWTDRLSEYVDDELTPGERAAIEAHVAECGACRAMLAELSEVVQTARGLADRPPTTDLWAGIHARIAGEHIIRDARFGERSVRATPGRIFAFSLPQLVAAAALLVAVSAATTWVVRSRVTPGPDARVATAPRGESEPTGAVLANFADPAYEAAIADLQRALQEGPGRLDPRTVQVLERNLAVIDQAIAQARDALESDPANTYLNNHLAEARQRKLALLRSATALTTLGG